MPREHDWSRPHFFAHDICRTCKQPRAGNVASTECPGSPVRTDDRGNLFTAVEATLIDYFETAVPGATVLQEASEWYAEIEGHRVFITAMALAVAEGLQTP